MLRVFIVIFQHKMKISFAKIFFLNDEKQNFFFGVLFKNYDDEQQKRTERDRIIALALIFFSKNILINRAVGRALRISNRCGLGVTREKQNGTESLGPVPIWPSFTILLHPGIAYKLTYKNLNIHPPIHVNDELLVISIFFWNTVFLSFKFKFYTIVLHICKSKSLWVDCFSFWWNFNENKKKMKSSCCFFWKN